MHYQHQHQPPTPTTNTNTTLEPPPQMPWPTHYMLTRTTNDINMNITELLNEQPTLTKQHWHEQQMNNKELDIMIK